MELSAPGGRSGVGVLSQDLFTNPKWQDVPKLCRSFRIHRRLVPNCIECEPFVNATSSTAFQTGVILVRLLGAGSRSSKVRKLMMCEPLSGEEPAFSRPCLVYPKRNMFTRFCVSVELYPTANPLLLVRFVKRGACPGNCCVELSLSF